MRKLACGARDRFSLTPHRCCALPIPDRTLDLQAPTIAVRNTWMHAIHQILVHSGYNVHEVDGTGESPNPGGLKSPTSASIVARDEARKLAALQVASPMGSPPASAGPSRLGSPTTIPSGQMLSPPPNAAPMLNSPHQAGSKFTPANTPVQTSSSPTAQATLQHQVHMRSMPEPQMQEDPLVVSKLQALSNGAVTLSPMGSQPATAASSPLHAADATTGAAAADREIPAVLVVSDGLQLSTAGAQPAVFSPSEHPTQTPACSPAMAR